jgi:hypothetical protein
MKCLAMFFFTVLVSSCAKHPDKIKSQYISPLVYSEYSCDQIISEMQRLTSKISELRGIQQNASTKSNVATGVGVVLFWPALFFIDSNSEQASEYARLKGEYDALGQAAIQKNCNIK